AVYPPCVADTWPWRSVVVRSRSADVRVHTVFAPESVSGISARHLPEAPGFCLLVKYPRSSVVRVASSVSGADPSGSKYSLTCCPAAGSYSPVPRLRWLAAPCTWKGAPAGALDGDVQISGMFRCARNGT